MTAPSESVETGELDTSTRTSRLRAAFTKHVEIIGTVLLSAATVLTAWSAFQNTKWSGVQATMFSQASATRAESVRASTQAGQQAVVDASVFTAWLTANDQGQTGLADLIAARFRGEFKTAFDAWLATSPLTNPTAPATPFAMPAYRLADAQRAAELDKRATGEFQEATDANETADQYVLMTVLFATVMFFGGVGPRSESFRVEMTLLVISGAVLLAAAGITATFPVDL